MSSKYIFIKNKSYLSFKNNSLCIKNENTDTSVCLDDIDTIIIENQQTTLTSSLLANLAEANISTIFTNKNFHPCAISVGLYKNSRTTKIQRAQLSVSKPRHNRLWKDIIYAKILNQADTLSFLGGKNNMYNLLPKITSADKGNIEAHGARLYFNSLFGKDFCRKNENDTRNAVLNYGYSIIRSSISRHVIAYGLNPSFGIWHSSELNSFNLSDDLIEPFRPIVDKYVFENIQKDSIFLPRHKQELIGILYKTVKTEQGNMSINETIKWVVSSYQSFCLEKRSGIFLFTLELK